MRNEAHTHTGSNNKQYSHYIQKLRQTKVWEEQRKTTLEQMFSELLLFHTTACTCYTFYQRYQSRNITTKPKDGAESAAQCKRWRKASLKGLPKDTRNQNTSTLQSSAGATTVNTKLAKQQRTFSKRTHNRLERNHETYQSVALG